MSKNDDIKDKKITTPSVLAFERSIDPSDALFFAGNWHDIDDIKNWQPIEVGEKTIRGTISNRLKTQGNDSAKLDAKITDSNIQFIDVAMLPNDKDTLKVNFTVRILGNLGHPCVCNNNLYQQKLRELVGQYIKDTQCEELAKRYAYNIANARFLWRNRLCVEDILLKVSIFCNEQKQISEELIFNSKQFSIKDFSTEKLDENNSNAYKKLSNIIQNALKDDTNQYNYFVVNAFVKIGKGQEVFPSQEFVQPASKINKGDKSKHLYKVSYDNQNSIAAMHSQKIGNAIRTIDDWYCDNNNLDNNDFIGPISIEPYGSVTTLGTAFRQPSYKNDFYTLLDNWVVKQKELELEQKHFVIANFIRGGVFGETEKEKNNN